jgi:NTE family protein
VSAEGEPTLADGRAPSPSDRKLGLALSGGGFRAAFFHIGVLARLAELGMLRHLKVISTVSGGSILGALYYLHVKDLLETKRDEVVDDADYLTIVRRLESSFLAGVQQNVRARTFEDVAKNWRMRKANYSRSDRIGELYDEVFYRPAWNEPLFRAPPSKPRQKMIELRELLIQPAGVEGPFDPTRGGNDGRRAPVPILVINATALNTGHNWRFEAVGMGEPDRDEDAIREVDRDIRLVWSRFRLPGDSQETSAERLPEHQSSFELGLAVAASACVPGLFAPLAVSDLFAEDRDVEKDIRVELVDGGVHDNQGIDGLLDKDCTDFVVSDASGQMLDEPDPPTRIPSVQSRSAGIYGDRIREIQLIEARRREKLRDRPLAIMHLRKGVPGVALFPLGGNEQALSEPRTEPPDGFHGELFGVLPQLQESLARVRTDLDSFSEVEAYSLMLDGYRMAGANLPAEAAVGGLARFVRSVENVEPWRFAAVAEALAGGANERFNHHLLVARNRFFKPSLLNRRAKGTRTAGATGIGVLALTALAHERTRRRLGSALTHEVPMWRVLAAADVAGALAWLYLHAKVRSRRLQRLANGVYGKGMPAALALPLWLASKALLRRNARFLELGRVGAVLGRRPFGGAS